LEPGKLAKSLKAGSVKLLPVATYRKWLDNRAEALRDLARMACSKGVFRPSLRNPSDAPDRFVWGIGL
jgi:hypothetical protein